MTYTLPRNVMRDGYVKVCNKCGVIHSFTQPTGKCAYCDGRVILYRLIKEGEDEEKEE